MAIPVAYATIAEELVFWGWKAQSLISNKALELYKMPILFKEIFFAPVAKGIYQPLPPVAKILLFISKVPTP